MLDDQGVSTTNSATSVTATAVNDPATFTGALANLGTPIILNTSVTAAPTPFLALGLTDPDVGHTDTVTITLSNPAFATVTNLGTGSYANGVCSFTGTAAELTAAIHGLEIIPLAVSLTTNGFVTSTNVTFVLVGSGGSPASLTAVLASQVQVLGSPTTLSAQVSTSVSSDGTDFATAVDGKTNEAVLTSPIVGGIYTLPANYQAEYLGGSNDATLQGNSAGNAVLVGNTGNDVLIGGAGNDSIIAGNGNNTLEGGSGTVALDAANGNDSITTATDSTYTVSVGGGADTIFANGSGTVTGGSGSDLINASGDIDTNINMIVPQGVHRSVLGGASALTVLDDGAHDTIQAAGGATNVTLNGSFGRTRGGTGNFIVDDPTANSTVIGGTAGTMFVTVGASASNADVFGRAGNTNILDLGADALMGAGGGNSVVSISGAGIQLYGSFSPGGTLNVSIGAANAKVFGLRAARTRSSPSPAVPTQPSTPGPAVCSPLLGLAASPAATLSTVPAPASFTWRSSVARAAPRSMVARLPPRCLASTALTRPRSIPWLARPVRTWSPMVWPRGARRSTPAVLQRTTRCSRRRATSAWWPVPGLTSWTRAPIPERSAAPGRSAAATR